MAQRVKVKVSNTSSKRTQYHYTSSVGVLTPGKIKELSIKIGDTLYFENDSNKYLISEGDAGRTFYYDK